MRVDFKTAKEIHDAGVEKAHTTPEPEGQKFPCSSRVRLKQKWGWIAAGTEATVLYTYAQAFWGDDVKSYCLNVDGHGETAWHDEGDLELIT